MIKKLYTRAGAIVTASVLGMSSGSAMAQGGSQTISGISSNMQTQASTVPILLSWVAYVGGAGLAIAGIFKLRQHVDNPTQVPMKDGLVRLVCGGGLIAVPAILAAMQDFAGGTSGMTVNTLTGIQ